MQTGELASSNPEAWAQTRLTKSSPLSSDDLVTLFDLLPVGEIQKGSREVRQAFVTGCYAQVGDDIRVLGSRELSGTVREIGASP